ncbi:MAG: hypothetical protein HY999_01510 [Nitrospinae bacterium]|nr:hypothetical protein [Nitrospinota bacterium]
MVESAGVKQIISMSAAIEKVQQVQQQQSDMQGRHFAILLREEERQRRKEVQTSEKAGETRISEGDKRRGERRSGKGRRYGERREDSTSDDDIKPGKIVDIVI